MVAVPNVELPSIRVPPSGPILKYPPSFVGKVLSVQSDGTVLPTEDAQVVYSITDPRFGGSTTATGAVNKAAVQAAAAAAASNKDGPVYFPEGTFTFESGIVLPANVSLQFSPGCVVRCTDAAGLFLAKSTGVDFALVQATTNAYTTVISLDAAPPVGSYIALEPDLLGNPNDPRQWMIFRVEDVTGGGPYSVSLDRPANVRWAQNTKVQLLTSVIGNLDIQANKALFELSYSLLDAWLVNGLTVSGVVVDSSAGAPANNVPVVSAIGCRDVVIDTYEQRASSVHLAGIVCWSCNNAKVTNITGVGLSGAGCLSPLVDVDDSLNVEIGPVVGVGFAYNVLLSTNALPTYNPLGSGDTNVWIHDVTGADCGYGASITGSVSNAKVERVFASNVTNAIVDFGFDLPVSGTDPTVVGCHNVVVDNVLGASLVAGCKGVWARQDAHSDCQITNVEILSGAGYLPAELVAPVSLENITWPDGVSIGVGTGGTRVGTWKLSGIHSPLIASASAAGALDIECPAGSIVDISDSELVAYSTWAFYVANAVTVLLRNSRLKQISAGKTGYFINDASGKVVLDASVQSSATNLAASADILKTTLNGANGALSLDMSTGSKTLTYDQSKNAVLQLTGALGADVAVRTLQLPGALFTVVNGTSVAHTVTVGSQLSGDPGVVLTQGKTAMFQVNAAGNMLKVSAEI